MMRTERVLVRGRPASYAVGGRGLPVVFLHGWGLDHEVYAEPLQRLTARGCRVLAPSLPGFGRTAALPLGERSLAGYARWVGEFLDAVGEGQPVLVLGHSFGGGVATRFAHDFGHRVRYLVLLNSVGDRVASAWSANRAGGARRRVEPSLVPRPAWLGGTGVRALGRIQQALLTNLVRNPAVFVHVALVASTADLGQEVAELARQRLPVLVLGSDRDAIVPMSAFDAFCSALGTEGRVISGGHSWLLTDPDVFDEVLDNVLRLQLEEHHSEVAAATTRDLAELLAGTTVPDHAASELLAGAAPLWLLSDAPPVLAQELALCWPALSHGEVRVAVRPASSPRTFRVVVVAADRPGSFADTTSVLAREGLTVTAASVTTWQQPQLALHAVTVRADQELDRRRWEDIGRDLRQVVSGPAPRPFDGVGWATVTVDGEGSGGTVVRVVAEDAPGLLTATCRWFADSGVSIQAARVVTVADTADDVFVIDGSCDAAALAQHLRRQRPSAWGRASSIRELLPTCHRPGPVGCRTRSR
jgi:pimeloyl-ACP methyl ester carboxylesterase/glycine cleavage system regulatory protein